MFIIFIECSRGFRCLFLVRDFGLEHDVLTRQVYKVQNRCRLQHLTASLVLQRHLPSLLSFLTKTEQVLHLGRAIFFSPPQPLLNREYAHAWRVIMTSSKKTLFNDLTVHCSHLLKYSNFSGRALEESPTLVFLAASLSTVRLSLLSLNTMADHSPL